MAISPDAGTRAPAAGARPGTTTRTPPAVTPPADSSERKSPTGGILQKTTGRAAPPTPTSPSIPHQPPRRSSTTTQAQAQAPPTPPPRQSAPGGPIHSPGRAPAASSASASGAGLNASTSADLPCLPSRASHSGAPAPDSPQHPPKRAASCSEPGSELPKLCGGGGGAAAADALDKARTGAFSRPTISSSMAARRSQGAADGPRGGFMGRTQTRTAAGGGGGMGTLRARKPFGGGGGGGARDQQLPPGGGGEDLETTILLADAEAKIREMTARMEEMQLDHTVAVNRLEGEAAYRKTQAAAQVAALQRQCGAQEEELRRLRQSLAASEGCAKQLVEQATEYRRQLADLTQSLAEKTQDLGEVRALLGADKGAMDTVISMLREQLKAAHEDRAAKAQRITELEYMVVHRDALLAEAEERVNRAAAAAAEAAAAHSSPPAVAAAAKSAAQPAPLDAAGAWGVLAETVATHAATSSRTTKSSHASQASGSTRRRSTRSTGKGGAVQLGGASRGSVLSEVSGLAGAAGEGAGGEGGESDVESYAGEGCDEE
ncbi:hypothetical protein HYH03_014884 [Edaphochlamys debaryana]|uniref:Uncharacterized protein n=1 Tax=Edaphochlamys debaryana TaxID=47281 RepID=A0A835XKH5_9CHLO|nr:hypothetical protein HYH03_014884 [Edaphochlamys debaryana]|eukprot:KAG2486437.1 hypothetical protein HYH03_014884 [Edaphochlamys debaryana]